MRSDVKYIQLTNKIFIFQFNAITEFFPEHRVAYKICGKHTLLSKKVVAIHAIDRRLRKTFSVRERPK